MKNKHQHLQCLREVQRSICRVLDKVNKEGHIPVWQLRIWGSKVKDAANFMKKELIFQHKHRKKKQ